MEFEFQIEQTYAQTKVPGGKNALFEKKCIAQLKSDFYLLRKSQKNSKLTMTINRCFARKTVTRIKFDDINTCHEAGLKNGLKDDLHSDQSEW
ncbi:hypothetical protein RUM43_013459 [Polyplax serrata]|uniref:Uncharacterized protein n=1 Tax=Polyplax serrata TaxID=468196 RepID=A0AAN8PRW9_POLSC